jgi:hypothetical protein
MRMNLGTIILIIGTLHHGFGTGEHALVRARGCSATGARNGACSRIIVLAQCMSEAARELVTGEGVRMPAYVEMYSQAQ